MNYAKLTGDQFSSLCNTFGSGRLLEKVKMPQTITGFYLLPMDQFGRAVFASCEPFRAKVQFSEATHHKFNAAHDATFCRQCGFTAAEHKSI